MKLFSLAMSMLALGPLVSAEKSDVAVDMEGTGEDNNGIVRAVRYLNEDGDDSGDVAVVAAVIVVVMLLTIAGLWVFLKGIKWVQQAEVMIIERLGRYQRTLKPGLHWVWPIIESPRT